MPLVDLVVVIEIGASDELLKKFNLGAADVTAEGALTDTAIRAVNCATVNRRAPVRRVEGIWLTSH